MTCCEQFPAVRGRPMRRQVPSSECRCRAEGPPVLSGVCSRVAVNFHSLVHAAEPSAIALLSHRPSPHRLSSQKARAITPSPSAS